MLTAKISGKNTLQGFGGNTYSKNSKYKKFFFFVFPIYKMAKYKNMSLILAKGYDNAKVHAIQVKNDLWVSMKDVGNGLDVKNISDLVLKEIYGVYEKKKLTKEEIKCFRMTERVIFTKFGKLSNNELDKLCNKSVFVKNTIMASITNHCKSEKKRYKGNIWIQKKTIYSRS